MSLKPGFELDLISRYVRVLLKDVKCSEQEIEAVVSKISTNENSQNSDYHFLVKTAKFIIKKSNFGSFYGEAMNETTVHIIKSLMTTQNSSKIYS